MAGEQNVVDVLWKATKRIVTVGQPLPFSNLVARGQPTSNQLPEEDLNLQRPRDILNLMEVPQYCSMAKGIVRIINQKREIITYSLRLI